MCWVGTQIAVQHLLLSLVYCFWNRIKGMSIITPQQPTEKARSRLKKKLDVKPVPSGTRSPVTVAPLLKRYLKHSPLLIIFVLHVLTIWHVMTTIAPESWKDIVLPSSFLPMLLLITSASFFLASYFFLNTGRGFRIAVTIGGYFFLKFQKVEMTPGVIVFLVAFFVSLELTARLLSVIKNRRSKKNNK